MPNIRLLNEANIASKDFALMVKAAQYFVPRVVASRGLPAFPVTTVADPAKPDDWLIHFTMNKRHTSALAYHAVENGIPCAYVLPMGSPFGQYTPVVIRWLTKLVGKVRVNVSILTKRPATFREGIITEACHEIAEMVCDSLIKTFSDKPDAWGRHWLIEVCDHVFGTDTEKDIGFGNFVVFPNFTYPSLYDPNGKAPFDEAGILTAPFTMTPKGYGYYKGCNGNLFKL